MSILYLRALHVIFVVAWFSALFFWGRMLIYIAEAQQKEEPEKQILVSFFKKSCKRILTIILIPSLILTVIFGTLLMIKLGAYKEGWFHIKLLLVVFFLAYHGVLYKKMKQLFQESYSGRVLTLRLLNEVPFLFLICIVFTVFLRSFFSGLWAAVIFMGVLLLAGLIFKLQTKRSKS